MSQVAMYVGYVVMLIASAALLLGFLAILAAWGIEVFKDIHKVAVNTYWWTHWIRWHRIARHRKEERKLQVEIKNQIDNTK